MIEYCQGNLLEADADALVNTVNCVGFMGKGIALQFKQAHPDNFRAYERACKRDEVRLGQMFTFSTDRVTPPRFIINFPTKGDWRSKSRLTDIRAGLADLVGVVRTHAIRSVALPPLGCGLGGLSWDDVHPLIVAAFAELPDVRVLLYAPQPAPDAAAMPVATKRPRMTRHRALLVSLISRYLGPGYTLTKLEVQKLAYFLQEAGENLRLEFVAHKFGPYAEKLNHSLRDMEGHLTRGFGDRVAHSAIGPVDGAVAEATDFLAVEPGADSPLRRVSELIRGYEEPYSMELLATVHWAAVHGSLPVTDAASAVAAVHAWSERKSKLFPPNHIVKAYDRLAAGGWLSGQPER